jgi:uncharacterized protein YlzI (FlbEa/FlbD family)
MTASATQRWPVILTAFLAIVLVELHGPDGQRYYVNPAEITSIREPIAKEHFAHGTRCVIVMTSGKFISTREGCDEVRKMVSGDPPR